MGVFDEVHSKATNVIVASMESEGARIQADMLDWVTASEGQSLAGLLFLTAIIAAIFTFAAGGNYRAARCLLVGPPLFFFLTVVRVPHSMTQWQFGEDIFPQEYVEQSLQAVGSGQAAGKVSLFFQYWSIFSSEITQRLIQLLKLTEDQSHLDFITKIERYMREQNFDQIKDTNIRILIRTVVASKCARYYMLQKTAADPTIDIVSKSHIQDDLAEMENDRVVTIDEVFRQDENELVSGLIEASQAGFAHELNKQNSLVDEPLQAGKTYTCGEIWRHVVSALRPQVQDQINKSLESNLSPLQEPDKVRQKFYRKICLYNSRATGQYKDNNCREGAAGNLGGVIEAVDWVIGRSLWHLMWSRNPYTDAIDLEGHSGVYASISGGGEIGGGDAYNTFTSQSIRRYNRSASFGFKSGFLNAAMALPNFQAVGLLLLAASYPFFAMVVILPGRAGSLFLWMGLWMWLKLWDFGFAIVMMIDNILYVMFPRGPNVGPGDITEAGRTWVRIMEVDSNYSSAMYYNIIATCMYSVPVVTGFLIKRGGSELINTFSDNFQSFSNRLSGSAATYAFALQTNTIFSQYVAQEDLQTIKGALKALMDPSIQRSFGVQAGLAQDTAAMDFTKELAKEHFGADLGGLSPATFAEFRKALNTGLKGREKAAVIAALELGGQLGAMQYAVSPEGWRGAEDAIASRYSTHDFSADRSYPSQAMLGLYMAFHHISDQSMVGDITDRKIGNGVVVNRDGIFGAAGTGATQGLRGRSAPISGERNAFTDTDAGVRAFQFMIGGQSGPNRMR